MNKNKIKSKWKIKLFSYYSKFVFQTILLYRLKIIILKTEWIRLK